MRSFFGFIELFLGILLLIFVIGSSVFFSLFGENLFNNLVKFFIKGGANESAIYLSLLNLSVMVIGFGILFFILGIILIINGILDLKGE